MVEDFDSTHTSNIAPFDTIRQFTTPIIKQWSIDYNFKKTSAGLILHGRN